MNRITINGKTITCSGTNVVISNGKVINFQRGNPQACLWDESHVFFCLIYT